MNNKLAIIIPAYKTSYLEETLKSISNQSCKKFTLYIGDDASPNNVYEIVKKFENDIDIVYKRFEQNLGGHDLIGHWNRCIDLSIEEEWLWLFSDDDLLTTNCVEEFYKYLELDNEAQLLHFNTDIIDENGKCYAKGNQFPSRLSSVDFFKKRIKGQIFSFVVEYVFTRKLYFDNNKFQAFDLAWCADDATWVKFAKDVDIVNIDSTAMVYWRYSGQNISSLNIDESVLYRKLNSKVSYLKWATEFFRINKIDVSNNNINIVKWILLDMNEFYYLPFLKRIKIAYKYASQTGNIVNGLLGVLYVSYLEFKFWNKKYI